MLTHLSTNLSSCPSVLGQAEDGELKDMSFLSLSKGGKGTSITFFPGCPEDVSFSPSSFSLVMPASLDSRLLLMKFWYDVDTGDDDLFICIGYFLGWCLSIPQLPRTASGGLGSPGWCRSSRSWSFRQPAGPSSTAHWCSAACNPADSADRAGERWNLSSSKEKQRGFLWEIEKKYILLNITNVVTSCYLLGSCLIPSNDVAEWIIREGVWNVNRSTHVGIKSQNVCSLPAVCCTSSGGLSRIPREEKKSQNNNRTTTKVLQVTLIQFLSLEKNPESEPLQNRSK